MTCRNSVFRWLVVFSLSFACAANLFCEEISVEQKAQNANIAIHSLFNERWITLPDFAFLFNGSLRRDPLSRRTEIAFNKHQLVILPGSKKAVYDGEVKEMNQPAQFIAGVEAITASFASSIATLAFVPAAQPAFKPVPTGSSQAGAPADDRSRAIPGIAELLAEPGRKGGEFLIVIDPGHGGQDTGAIGPWGLQEKDVNLDLSLRVSEYLKRTRTKMDIVLTRKDDTFISLPGRTQIANQMNADLFVCIHTNSARMNRYTADGFETYYPTSKPVVVASSGNSQDEIAALLPRANPNEVVQRGQYLAGLIQEKLADRLITPDRGIKGRSFYVIKYTRMVSVLVEVGFICNPNIEANLRLPEVRQAIAEAIGGGVLAYLDGQPLRGKIESRISAGEEPANE